MNKAQIENVIKKLEERGHEVNYKTYTNNSVSFYCNEHSFSINYEGAEPVVAVGICFDCRTFFDQNDVDWLNSITSHWEIYKHCIMFSFIAETENKLETVLLHCIECF